MISLHAKWLIADKAGHLSVPNAMHTTTIPVLQASEVCAYGVKMLFLP
jgi:hypothetical protein